MMFTYNCIFDRWVKCVSTTSPAIHANSFDPTLVLLRLIFGWKLKQTKVLFPNLPYRVLPHFGTQQYYPCPPGIPPKSVALDNND